MIKSQKNVKQQSLTQKRIFTSLAFNEPMIQFSWTTMLYLFFGVPLGVYLYKCTALVLFQNKLIYMPYLPWDGRKLAFDESLVDKRLVSKQVKVKTSDMHELVGIILRAKATSIKDDVRDGSNAPVMIYLQGNAGNTLLRLPLFSRLLLPPKNSIPNLHVVAISYRGYWLSTGSPSEYGLKKDAIAIYEYVRELFPKNPLYVYGHSLGGAVALYLASQQNIQKDLKGIIIENTFTSIKDMVLSIYPQKWLPYKYLVRLPFILWNKWDNSRTIQGITTPILFLSSYNDEIVPRKQMLELFRLAEKSKKKVWINFDKALHMDTYIHRGYVKEINQFIEETK
ncbi:10050_t:CDS:2 [Funneliformis caledonium]|uniref:10050_t:CDS:1 n=1 Tax=Funneliformis caledonium TaxID=1117310 RepID=A0A9N9FH85_9GLOM|nr:10050_t:CDS:2 [Funneliformis caledonium]